MTAAITSWIKIWYNLCIYLFIYLFIYSILYAYVLSSQPSIWELHWFTASDSTLWSYSVCSFVRLYDLQFLAYASPSPRALRTSLTLSGSQLYPSSPIRHSLPIWSPLKPPAISTEYLEIHRYCNVLNVRIKQSNEESKPFIYLIEVVGALSLV